MRYLRYSFYAVLMLVFVMLALANREVVTLALLPELLSGFFPNTIALPLYVVILLSMLAGLLVGYVLEYFREHKLRREAAIKKREAADLARQVDALKKQAGTQDDDVLALLN
ncbi:MAG: lipopolysaccharide assembly protein LapA domain-containing protein [Alphaproteobacteria bacterium]